MQQTKVTVASPDVFQIIPIHYTPSQEVTKEWLSEAMKKARGIASLIDRNEFPRGRECFAIHHSQVADRPLNLFVLDKRRVKQLALPSRFIFNATWEQVEHPHLLRIPEACMSFPHREAKKVTRHFNIEATYYTPRLLLGKIVGLKEHTETLTGKAAQVFQHECEHAQGKNIFFDAPKG